MNRRHFLQGVAGALLAASLAAEAEQAGKVYRIGYLAGSSASADAPLLAAFRQGMSELDTERDGT